MGKLRINYYNIKFIENGPFFRHPYSSFTYSANRRDHSEHEAFDHNIAPEAAKGFFSTEVFVEERILHHESTNESAQSEDST